MKLQTIPVVIIALVVIVGGLIAARIWSERQPGQYDELAQCINESGAAFYGAFWCPHCDEQKALFGNSERLLPYVECSTPDGQNQTQECIDAEIKSYPTWELAEGTRLPGVQTPQELAEATDCSLPSAN